MPWQHSDGVRHAGRNPDKCLPVQERKQQIKAFVNKTINTDRRVKQDRDLAKWKIEADCKSWQHSYQEIFLLPLTALDSQIFLATQLKTLFLFYLKERQKYNFSIRSILELNSHISNWKDVICQWVIEVSRRIARPKSGTRKNRDMKTSCQWSQFLGGKKWKDW